MDGPDLRELGVMCGHLEDYVHYTHVRGKYRKSACLSSHLGVKIGVKFANV